MDTNNIEKKPDKILEDIPNNIISHVDIQQKLNQIDAIIMQVMLAAKKEVKPQKHLYSSTLI